ncbi:phosphotransferase family protein [Thermus igniterrae]|jgi:aminoglycoside phosphotransferase (APT) family kinase protein|uniref:phosphotransferase family protein n=1 Tax=Thermus igniterrae TaxID=88189 RepID=UPI00037D0712|nr:phosphotransferase family protein [Thermus igniterrae]
MKEALEAFLKALLGPGEVVALRRLTGGASKEAWAVDYQGPEGMRPLFLRRAGGGVIYHGTLPLEKEFRLLELAHRHGVPVPRPVGYLAEVEGREAFLMERLEGESIGTRVVRRPELARARATLPLAMAEALARIHAIPLEAVDFLPRPGDQEPWQAALASAYQDLDALEEPHPALEWGLRWLADHPPRPLPRVLVHGDFRIGNLLVDQGGLVAVLDWEFAHIGDPREDLAWPLVRAWRFGEDGRRLGGVGEVAPFLERYNALTGMGIGEEELFWWEVLGNIRWGLGALNQARRHLRGEERSVELAILGRLAAEMEYEILYLLERHG